MDSSLPEDLKGVNPSITLGVYLDPYLLSKCEGDAFLNSPSILPNNSFSMYREPSNKSIFFFENESNSLCSCPGGSEWNKDKEGQQISYPENLNEDLQIESLPKSLLSYGSELSPLGTVEKKHKIRRPSRMKKSQYNQLSPEEKDKRTHRMERERARNYRAREKQKEELLRNEAKSYELENSNLHTELRRLKIQEKQLLQRLDGHRMCNLNSSSTESAFYFRQYNI